MIRNIMEGRRRQGLLVRRPGPGGASCKWRDRRRGGGATAAAGGGAPGRRHPGAGFFQTVGAMAGLVTGATCGGAEVVLRGQVEYGALGVALDARGALGR